MPVGDVTNINDSPIGSEDYRPPVDNERLPSEGDILTYDATTKNYYPAAAVQTNSFIATDDAGDGTVADDVNNTDFTGQSPIIGQAAHIILNSINTFVHKDVAYNWVGPTDVTVGIGGSYVATPADFAGIGTADHALLVSRSDPDQHPISAITGLVQEQSDQDAATALVQSNLDQTNLDVAALDVRVGTNETNIASNDVDIAQNASDIAANAAEIVRQQGEMDTDEANLAAHLADITPECHDQYATEAASLASFTAAGYGGIGVNTPVGMSDIGNTWQTITGFDLELLPSPKGVTHDLANDGLRLNFEGVWMLVVKVSLTFAEAQAGRVMQMRLMNGTDGTPSGVTFNFYVGRNQAGVNLNMTMAFDTLAENVGDLIQLQVSSPTDSFTGVTNIGTIYQIIHVSEAKFLPPL